MGERFGADGASARWELYRLLADPVRPRLLALASIEELAVGELAELLREGQPKISRHAAALRDAGLLVARRHGTFTLLRLAPDAARDAVVADAVAAGRASCDADGTTKRVEEVLAARDADTREFFARGGRPLRVGPPEELPAYLVALRTLLPARALAVDVGTGDGALLEVLAPLFDRVIAVDRADAQLELAAGRARRRGFENVDLVRGEIDGPEVRAAVRRRRREGADVVFASRVLHHAPTPARALRAMAALARPGGAVLVLDYEPHDDEGLRAQQADFWLGFEPAELDQLARDVGLEDVRVTRVPEAFRGEGPDRHVGWQLLAARRSEAHAARDERPAEHERAREDAIRSPKRAKTKARIEPRQTGERGAARPPRPRAKETRTP